MKAIHFSTKSLLCTLLTLTLAFAADASAMSCQDLTASIVARRKEKDLQKILEASGARDVPASPASLKNAEADVAGISRPRSSVESPGEVHPSVASRAAAVRRLKDLEGELARLSNAQKPSVVPAAGPENLAKAPLGSARNSLSGTAEVSQRSLAENAQDLAATGRMRAALDRNLPEALANLERLLQTELDAKKVLSQEELGQKTADLRQGLRTGSQKRIELLEAELWGKRSPELEVMIRFEKELEERVGKAFDRLTAAQQSRREAESLVEWMKRTRAELTKAENDAFINLSREMAKLPDADFVAAAMTDLRNGQVATINDIHLGKPGFRSSNADGLKGVEAYLVENPDAFVHLNGDMFEFAFVRETRQVAEIKFLASRVKEICGGNLACKQVNDLIATKGFRRLVEEKGIEQAISSPDFVKALQQSGSEPLASEISSPKFRRAATLKGLEKLAVTHVGALESVLRSMGADSDSVIKRMLQRKGLSPVDAQAALKDRASLEEAMSRARITRQEMQTEISSRQGRLSSQLGNHDLNGRTVNGKIEFFEGELEALAKALEGSVTDRFGFKMGMELYFRQGYEGSVTRLVGARETETTWNHLHARNSPLARPYVEQMLKDGLREPVLVPGVSRGTQYGADLHGAGLVHDEAGRVFVSAPSVTIDGKGGGGFVVQSLQTGMPYIAKVAKDPVTKRMKAAISAAELDRLQPASRAQEIVNFNSRPELTFPKHSQMSKEASTNPKARGVRDNQLAWKVEERAGKALGYTDEADVARLKAVSNAYVHGLGKETNGVYLDDGDLAAKARALEAAFDGASDAIEAKLAVKPTAVEREIVKKLYVEQCIQQGFCLKADQLAMLKPQQADGAARLSKAGNAGEDAAERIRLAEYDTSKLPEWNRAVEKGTKDIDRSIADLDGNKAQAWNKLADDVESLVSEAKGRFKELRQESLPEAARRKQVAEAARRVDEMRNVFTKVDSQLIDPKGIRRNTPESAALVRAASANAMLSAGYLDLERVAQRLSGNGLNVRSAARADAADSGATTARLSKAGNAGEDAAAARNPATRSLAEIEAEIARLKSSGSGPGSGGRSGGLGNRNGKRLMDLDYERRKALVLAGREIKASGRKISALSARQAEALRAFESSQSLPKKILALQRKLASQPAGYSKQLLPWAKALVQARIRKFRGNEIRSTARKLGVSPTAVEEAVVQCLK
jgi:hypothetical protein